MFLFPKVVVSNKRRLPMFELPDYLLRFFHCCISFVALAASEIRREREKEIVVVAAVAVVVVAVVQSSRLIQLLTRE